MSAEWRTAPSTVHVAKAAPKPVGWDELDRWLGKADRVLAAWEAVKAETAQEPH